MGWLVMLIPLLVVGGSPGCELSKDPCCDRRSNAVMGGVDGRVRAGRVVRSGGLTKSSVLTGSSGESCWSWL